MQKVGAGHFTIDHLRRPNNIGFSHEPHPSDSGYPLLAILVIAISSLGISGGPNYGGGKTTVSVTGHYAGTLVPVSGSSNLGIFTVTIPQVGLATGDFTVFNAGRTFVGNLQGVADPTKASLYADLQAIPVVTAGDTTVTTLNYHANGSLTATVTASGKALTLASTRLKGNANVIITAGE